MSKNQHLTESLYNYIVENNPPIDALTQELIDETEAMGSVSGMLLGPDQAAFLAFLVGLINAQFVVEVGTFTGMSSLAMAKALPSGGTILCCDVSHEFTAVARRYWQRAGVQDRITLAIGPAEETLAILPADQLVDLAFIDADKEGYIGYYEALVPRLSARGAIVADNIFMGGRAIDPVPDTGGAAVAAFAEHLRNDPRTETVIVSIGDGFSLTRLV